MIVAVIAATKGVWWETVLFWVVIVAVVAVVGRSQAWRNLRTNMRINRDRKLNALAAVTCPSCHARNAQRVTTGQRVTSAAAGGILFSRKARAQFHCLNCNYYW